MALKLQRNGLSGLRPQASAVSRRPCCPVQVVQVCCRSAPGDSQPATAASSSGDEVAALKKQLAKMEEAFKRRQEESKAGYKQQALIQQLRVLSAEACFWLVIAAGLGAVSGGTMVQMMVTTMGLVPDFRLTSIVARGMHIIFKNWLGG